MSDFKTILFETLRQLDITVSEKAADDLCVYYRLLTQWNERMNLTALTTPEDVALKHFGDCLTVLKYAEIPENAKLIDVGTGAGFPGLVLKIARPDLKLTLLDSLSKRLGFLSEVCAALGMEDVELIHARAEDGGHDAELRERFDAAVSRAVAPMNVLAEYCLPFVKPNGSFLAMKGKDVETELAAAENALEFLGGEVTAIKTFALQDAGSRSVITVKKVHPTPEKYPRAGKKIKVRPL